MKNFAKLIKLTLVATLFVSLFSCSDDDTTVEPVNNSIAAIASRAPQFTSLVTALDRAGLVQILDQPGPYTVFAPTNQAFTDAGINVNTINVDALRQVLLNHVVGGANLSANVTTGYVSSSAAYGTSETIKLSLFLEKTGTNIKVNGVANVDATARDILATNGVIHQVDAVIGLPTIVDHAKANPNFSTLVSVLTTQELVSTLEGTENSPFTVFAPLNSAFNQATLDLYGSLSSDDKTAVLTHHVVAGANVRSNAIPASATSFQGGTLTFAGTVITDASGGTSNIVAVDVQCANGVIHAIDKVLIPQL